MKTEVKKVYYCEHCRKHMLSASSMSRHEKYCRNKPENKHKCFDMCRHLKRERMVSVKGIQTVFSCKVTGVKMYSYLAEKKQTSYFGNPIKVDGLTRMPLDCKDYEAMSESEYCERFNIEL